MTRYVVLAFIRPQLAVVLPKPILASPSGVKGDLKVPRTLPDDGMILLC